MTLGRLSVLVAAAAALLTTACAARRPPLPYPSEPDPCQAYCLVWVPPTYRDVPTVVKCREGCVECKPAWRKDVCFEEVCRPGKVVDVCTPDTCRTHQVVQAIPPHLEWQQTCCPGPDSGCCYCPMPVPGKNIVCEKTVTEEGIRYCYQKPPQYDVVQHDVTTCVPMAHYKPAEYGVVWQKECFQPGRWEWRERPGCPCPPQGCAPATVCAPAPCEPAPCAAPPYGSVPYATVPSTRPAYVAPAPLPRRGDFGYAPAPN